MKPNHCPFCGEQPKSYDGGLGWHIGCWYPGCSIQPSGNYDSEEQAVEIWNRRPRPKKKANTSMAMGPEKNATY